MLAHDRKQPRARRLAWGLDYDAGREIARRTSPPTTREIVIDAETMGLDPRVPPSIRALAIDLLKIPHGRRGWHSARRPGR
jgi:hypothetical protein